MKEYKATQKYLIMSPRKLRLVVGLIKKMKPAEAIEKLPFATRRAAGDLAKVIKSALSNAKAQGVSETDLVFKEIQIGEGPRLKRGKAASRGRWHPFKHRMSHIRVILTTIKKEEEKIKSEKAVTEKKTDKKVEAVTPEKGGKGRRGTKSAPSEKA
jgi:large subunit ribosomal protein L22